ncbi:hypothetical protein A8990_14836 [Paenibacillus taihuensis]|uniref:Uncharacterized protein n=1 Tax=Paenibacillus taihuensis TaxID=1156355 RepID=A0A3D9QZV2_9BACL|nr:hypothetical protein [Paenibacillus taihuensis]REE66700.1 hypothetical protein A8990_14836 [Paenibacillus taihuensis]
MNYKLNPQLGVKEGDPAWMYFYGLEHYVHIRHHGCDDDRSQQRRGARYFYRQGLRPHALIEQIKRRGMVAMKFSDKMVADSGSFAPFLVGPDEFVLASVGLANMAPGDRIVLSFEIGWERLFEWDSVDLEIMLRESSETGTVLYWNMESCFLRARSTERHTIVGGAAPAQRYFLTVRSAEKRARITGPYSLQGAVYAP